LCAPSIDALWNSDVAVPLLLRPTNHGASAAVVLH
jgi:hypothetical protein